MSTFSRAIIATVMFGASAGLCAANEPTVIAKCPGGFKDADFNIQLTVSTNLAGCPLLEDKKLRKLVDKFGVGSVFAYPAVPGTCLSGTVLTGTITTRLDKKEKKVINVEGFSESAQRLFAEAEALNGYPSLFITGTASGVPFTSGAAMTVLSLKGTDSKFKLDLVLDDRFTIKPSVDPNTGQYSLVDTEDFLVVGAEGAEVTGRLKGVADISSGLDGALFVVSGTLCVK